MAQLYQLYWKDVAGTFQLFAINSAGLEFQLTPLTGGGEGPTNFIITDYTFTGSEGSDFMVTLSVAMLNDDYALLWSPKGCANSIPVIDLPDSAAGDRTTTEFRVLTAAQQDAGDKVTFIAFAKP